MLCICLSCCAPSRRAHDALGSPAPIQHLLSLPGPTLQHWGLWMGDAWSSRFICFNHYFMIWSVLFWVSKSYSGRESPQAWHRVGMLHWCFAFRPHTRAHTHWVLYPLYSQEGRQVQPNWETSQQPDTALCSWHALFLSTAYTTIPPYNGCVKSILICHITVTTTDTNTSLGSSSNYLLLLVNINLNEKTSSWFVNDDVFILNEQSKDLLTLF